VKIVLQRVSRAEVRVEGKVVGSIGLGHLLLVGFGRDDGTAQIEWMAEKVLGLRVFPDDEGKMNRSLEDAGGDLLVVSQFTLYGDSSKGRRPSFVAAAPPDEAEALYGRFVDELRSRTTRGVETGIFGAMMDVDLVNDGPVTLLLER
jgi:D-tyrosyl-tRNA(Tyr) deacylase